MRPTREWNIKVIVSDEDDGSAFTEGMMEAFSMLTNRLAEDVPNFEAVLTDTHGDVVLGGIDR